MEEHFPRCHNIQKQHLQGTGAIPRAWGKGRVGEGGSWRRGELVKGVVG